MHGIYLKNYFIDEKVNSWREMHRHFSSSGNIRTLSESKESEMKNIVLWARENKRNIYEITSQTIRSRDN